MVLHRGECGKETVRDMLELGGSVVTGCVYQGHGPVGSVGCSLVRFGCYCHFFATPSSTQLPHANSSHTTMRGRSGEGGVDSNNKNGENDKNKSKCKNNGTSRSRETY